MTQSRFKRRRPFHAFLQMQLCCEVPLHMPMCMQMLAKLPWPRHLPVDGLWTVVAVDTCCTIMSAWIRGLLCQQAIQVRHSLHLCQNSS